ncbi:DNA excision repair protein ERCC-6-like 2 isoform X2 [Echeneis naucrates]|uniref:DNA excision repair protein ERCC-6-like 2 isoform X2 n=1 Tax=Echeneis naucrates TaxID=173247 RepID=UPI0011140E6D|nr:DNA excision repair protein ERCC-6-like 2 isoform X2 [Echeneis naucrates]
MDSPSAAGKATWHDGDRCLAPNPRDGILQEAKIQRLTSTVHSTETTAWVIFTDHNNDEEEEEEVAVPISKLVRADLNCFTQEKPLFPNSIPDRRLCVPLRLSDVNEDKVPYTINRYLRDYQREGIRFIYSNYIRASGCILGDDMGLGKTVQVIGFLAAMLHKTGTWEDVKNNRPQFLQSQIPSKQITPKKVFLIVAPLSLLYNWKDELDTWGHFQYVVVHGLRKEEELARIKKGRTEIALTTFETLRLCLDQFNNTDWSAVIVDEAHKIKNPSSQITQAMKELKCKIRIGLTGTILQNNLEELWAVPGCLGSLGHFKNIFSEPIEQGQRFSATKRALATGRKTVRALVRKISHWFLRRTKALIKEQLPKKDDRVVYCSLTDFQQNVYQTVLDTEDVMLLLRSSEKCDCQSGSTRRRCCYKRNSEGVQIKELYFTYLAILRKVANHVALLQSSAGTSKKQEKYLSAICQMVFQKFPDFVQRCKDEAFEALSDPVYSGKMKVLQKLLKYYLQKRDKVLLFSLSTKLLDVLEHYCMAEGLDYRRLDGTTKSKERVQIVKEFNRSSHINLCLVSTMAGGLGLNFVGANVVVLFDPTWNPANDLQAIDRAYRIGQCRDVTILRLISLGTIEEIIYLRQVYKQQLQCSVFGKECSRRYFEAVQGHSVHKGELFGIKNLFHLQTQGTCLTRKIVEREGRMEAGVMTSSTHTDEEKEENRKGVSEPGHSAPTAGLSPNDEPIKETRNPSNVCKGVLDFSSGSEGDEDEHKLKRKAKVNDITAGNGPGQMSLLQHGFSTFLERVKETAVSGEEDDSPNTGESHFDTDAEDHGKLRKTECTSTGDINKSSSEVTEAVCLPKLGTKALDVCSASDREGQRNGSGGRQGGAFQSKERTDKFSRDKKSNKFKTAAPTIHCFEGYSDESEDFDLEESKSVLKKGTLHPPSTGKDRERGTLDSNRKRQSLSVRDKARAKYTEAIEAYTSSEDECAPVKKARSSGSHLTSLQTQQSRHDMPKDGERVATKDRTERQKRDGGTPKAVIFTNLKSETSPTPKGNKQQGKEGSIDSLLGGVQEVVSVHSNHRVVGGSKAEDLISIAAMRDVFERKMYSQLPANHLLGTQESLSESPPDETVRVERPSVAHPVSFTSKSVHRTRHSTIIIGETPHAIRRQQLEEMAEKFQFRSVHQFVTEILKSSSTQRLAWLRQYYTSLNHPGLANAVTKNFPQSDSRQITLAATSSRSTVKAATKSHTQTGTPQKDVPKAAKKPNCSLKNLQNDVPEPPTSPENPLNDVREPQKKQKISQKNVGEPVSDGPCTDSEEQEETLRTARGHRRTKRDSVSTPGAGCSAAGGLGSRKTAACLSRADRETLSSPDLSHGRSAMLSKPTAQGREREQKSASRTKHTFNGNGESCQTPPAPQQTPSTSSNRSFLKDLIGDTSILDDLFKPKPKRVQQRSTPKTPPISVSANTGPTTPSSEITPYTDSTPEGLLGSLSGLSSHTPSTLQVNTQVQPSKGGCKDFWDILNEGNEERINRLTDPAEVQRVCVNTNLSARNRSREDTKNLWKANEKFLWRK